MLGDAFRDMDLGDAFARVAPHVTKLAEGLAEMGINIMPGLNKALDRAGPFIDELADGLSDMGLALGTFFDEASESEGAIQGLHAAFNILNGTIVFTGRLIHFLSDAFTAWITMSRDLFDVLASIPGPMQGIFTGLRDGLQGVLDRSNRLPPAIDESGTAIESFGEAADVTARAIGRLGAALDDTQQGFLDLAGEEIDFEDALVRLKEAFRASGGAIGLHGTKSREARDSLRHFADQAIRTAESTAIQSKSVEAGNKVLDRARAELIRMALAANYSAAEARALADRWLGFVKLPTNVTKTGTIITNKITRNIQEYRGFAPGDVARPSGRAAGGNVLAGRVYEVNEQRREFFRPRTDGVVAPVAMLGGRAGRTESTANNYYSISVDVAPGGNPRDVGAAVVASIQAYERGNGTGWRS